MIFLPRSAALLVRQALQGVGAPCTLPSQPLSLSLLMGVRFAAPLSTTSLPSSVFATPWRPPADQPHWTLALQPHAGPMGTRGFAAKGSAVGAKADKPKKQRRGNKKLYACRNDRVRSMFEQIWPTMHLTEEEAMLFRRNSRVFVTDMGRSIPLKTKFALAKQDPHQKVPHQDVRSLIYESDFHLDAVGEHPRYLKIRKLRAGNFSGKLQAVRKLRLLLGFCRRKYIQKLFELSRLQPGPDRVWKLICAMEGTLGMTAMRMGLAHDSVAAQGMVNRCTLHVNGVRPLQPRVMFVQPGDVVSPSQWAEGWQKQYVASQLGSQLMMAVEKGW